jgi:hypothetical protein
VNSKEIRKFRNDVSESSRLTRISLFTHGSYCHLVEPLMRTPGGERRV